MKFSFDFLPVCLYFTIFYVYPRFQNQSLLKNQINASFPITFYHKVYVDYRTSPPRLRIFSLNPCIKASNYLLVHVYYNGTITKLKLNGYSFGFYEGNCPPVYGPARNCFYVPHHFYGVLPENGVVQKVSIQLGHREAFLSEIVEIGKSYEKGLTVCLQIVYYYSQWQNVILYIEAWRAQGATRFIVYFHSATQDTKKVLDYYEKLGLIELRPWPNVGALSSYIAPYHPKIDDSVFIIASHIALQVCSLEIRTELGIVADFDEVMVPGDGSVLEYAELVMAGKNIGALLFENTHVGLEPNIYTNDFSGMKTLTFINIFAPPKYIFNTSLIDICETHSPGKFLHNSTTTLFSNGTVLHFRFNIKEIKANVVEKPYRFFPNSTEGHIWNMHDTVRTVWNFLFFHV
ncbi:Glycosyltransferase family 92 protein [Caenorhabditis elegans]|uniref:Glycosyltransferase family 92 protein n=1 Tax=Caenorhabditis elegans TaxID=6239 RepID=Q9XXL9_CAEEL|nr:Glycosyltransferase family 92 protein [Caenorhabditis elegans]CAA18367.2 Glycosyltransferase family 92 protein [Caenorhabditis elegans]|eukprot:NP_001040718.1 Uncharacterized protein CELE_ZK1025.4 [Caenorhabditis elegans]